MGAGDFSLPNASQKICITRGESRDRVFAAASDFLLHRARSPRTPLISSWNRRILFLRDNVCCFRTEPVFLCSFHLISFLVPGLRACSAGRDTEKTTDSSGLCPVSYGEPHRQLNSHNGKEYLSFPGKYATTRSAERAKGGQTRSEVGAGTDTGSVV